MLSHDQTKSTGNRSAKADFNSIIYDLYPSKISHEQKMLTTEIGSNYKCCTDF